MVMNKTKNLVGGNVILPGCIAFGWITLHGDWRDWRVRL